MPSLDLKQRRKFDEFTKLSNVPLFKPSIISKQLPTPTCNSYSDLFILLFLTAPATRSTLPIPLSLSLAAHTCACSSRFHR
eukprot:3672307-Pleurochrysis_carterae.AAC.1